MQTQAVYVKVCTTNKDLPVCCNLNNYLLSTELIIKAKTDVCQTIAPTRLRDEFGLLVKLKVPFQVLTRLIITVVAPRI